MAGGFFPPRKLPQSLFDCEETGLEGTLLCLGLLESWRMSSQGLVFSSLQERGGQRLL